MRLRSPWSGFAVAASDRPDRGEPARMDKTANAKNRPSQGITLAPGRRVLLNMLDLTGRPHCMYGLLEVDVTVPRRLIAEHRERTGETLSFTGLLAFCLAAAVDENKAVQAYLKGRKQLVVFDDVDVALMVEKTSGDKTVLMGHVVRCANRKTYREIHDEIRSVQSAPAPANRGIPGWFRSLMLLPWPLSGPVKALLRLAVRRDPAILVQMGGTVGISAVGMFGKGRGGWGIYTPASSLELLVGSMAWKPAVVEGRIEPREILNLTVMFDHDVIDGAPAARFTGRLLELIETGHGLDRLATPRVA